MDHGVRQRHLISSLFFDFLVEWPTIRNFSHQTSVSPGLTIVTLTRRGLGVCACTHTGHATCHWDILSLNAKSIKFKSWRWTLRISFGCFEEDVILTLWLILMVILISSSSSLLQLLRVYPFPALCWLYIYHVHLNNNLHRKVVLYPFSTWRNWGLEKFSDLPEVSHPVSGRRAGFKTLYN